MNTTTTDNPTDTPVLTIGNGKPVWPGTVVFNAAVKGCPAKTLVHGPHYSSGGRVCWRTKGRGGEVDPTSLYATQAEAQTARLADLIELERKTLENLKATQAEIRKLKAAVR